MTLPFPLEILVGAVVVLGAVGTGTVVHELAHATVLGLAGVDAEIRWLEGGRAGRLGAGLFGTWASVRLTAVPADLPPWQLRAAALAPLLLAAPLVAIGLGVLPDPFASDRLYLKLLVVGWLACALPSPQDFSLVWNAPAVVATGGEDATGNGPGGDDATGTSA